MKKILGGIGTVVFWLMWPAWFVYFRNSGTRSRVLVVAGDEILLVQGLIGQKKYGLPGGGTKKNESVRASGARELNEELGIDIAESSLVRLGARMHRKYYLRYWTEYYVVQLAEKPELKLQKLEIFVADWVIINQVNNLKLTEEAVYALRRYQPPERPSLL